MNELIQILSTFVITLLSATPIINWLNKRKYVAESKAIEDQNKTTELQNVEGAIKIWREMAESLETKLSERDNSLNELKSQLEVITNQNKEMIEQMTALKKDYDKLEQNYNTLEKSLKS